jgi:RNase adapter protein RapZ
MIDAPDYTTSMPKTGEAREDIQLVCVTGRSGAGHSTALRFLEDAGFSSVDNVPLALVDQLTSLVIETEQRKLAIGIDLRTSGFDADGVKRLAENLRSRFKKTCCLVYVTATDDELIARYKTTRRRHPLMGRYDRLEQAIAADAHHAQIAPIADLVIDTTRLSPQAFCAELQARLELQLQTSPVLSIFSFAYKHGLPQAGDIIFDMRFLDNPHWQPELRPLTGCDSEVEAFIHKDGAFMPFMQDVTRQLELSLPLYFNQGRFQVSVGFGCSGGRHRSVAAARWLHGWAEKAGLNTTLSHRELH